VVRIRKNNGKKVKLTKGPERYTLQQLETLKNRYLDTLNDGEADETYTTDRGLAADEIEKFLAWLAEQ
jgi:hypothetical protein